MHEIISFNDWIIDKDSPYGSGASEKIWLVNIETQEKGIFKFPKTHTYGNITGEYWAEKIAYEIACVINMKCARVDIGEFNGRRGSMSYMLLNEDEELLEGIQYITNKFPYYSQDDFIDLASGEIYSMQMILESLIGTNLERDFLKIPIYDCLIGNSDRHHSNWGIVKNTVNQIIKIASLYDNGSSLCCYINSNDVDNFLNDCSKFESLIYGKSRSIIGWNTTKKIRHFDLLNKLKEMFYDETIEIVLNIKNKLTEDRIVSIISKYPENIIDSQIKKLLVAFLSERRKRILQYYEI